MAFTSSAPIWRALVARIRSNATLKAAIVGGIHEVISPEPVPIFPMVIYVPVVAPYEDDWGGRMIEAVVDVTAWSRSQVEANNLDQSLLEQLDAAELTPTGQTALICRRISDIRSVDVDEEGMKVYGVGGTYEIWTSQ